MRYARDRVGAKVGSEKRKGSMGFTGIIEILITGKGTVGKETLFSPSEKVYNRVPVPIEKKTSCWGGRPLGQSRKGGTFCNPKSS